MKKHNNYKSPCQRRGFTLMEILLVTGLLAIISGASLSLIYWQMRVQAHVNEGALVMNKLINTQMMVRKVLRSRNPASLSVDLNHSRILYKETASTEIDLFAFSGNLLNFKGSPIMENVVASFTKLLATGSPDLVTPTATLSPDLTNLIKIELATQGREKRNLHFLVRPRGI